MSITSSITIADTDIQADGLRNIAHELIDHLGVKKIYGPIPVPAGWTETEYAAERAKLEIILLDELALNEILNALDVARNGSNPSKVPNYQTQVQFDRRLLGYLMQEISAYTLYAAYPFFQAVQTRGGANNNQRASYLGISSVTYSLIDNRFNDVNGIAFFLNDDKNQRWDGLPEGYY